MSLKALSRQETHAGSSEHPLVPRLTPVRAQAPSRAAQHDVELNRSETGTLARTFAYMPMGR
jgi:hypothetical protein